CLPRWRLLLCTYYSILGYIPSNDCILCCQPPTQPPSSLCCLPSIWPPSAPSMCIYSPVQHLAFHIRIWIVVWLNSWGAEGLRS
ncbi:hypothetical protein B0H17DRAFT_1049630, partial [Mycena rosella]